MSTSSIPVIDIAPLMCNGVEGRSESAQERHTVVSALSAAVQSHGIFAIVGHEIPVDLMSDALKATKLALDKGGSAESERWEKMEAAVRPPGQLANFSAAGVENIGRVYQGKANAPKEHVAKFSVFPPRWETDTALLNANIWPATGAGEAFRETLEQYFAKVQRVSDAVHLGLSECLGQQAEFIKDALTPQTDGILRALHYQREDEGEEEMAPAMGAHKDLGTTTLLLSDAPGLQFQPRGSEDWVDVVVPTGALVVNLGEFFEIWTHGAWRATPHRVAQTARGGRTSLAFFSNQAIGRPSDGSAPKDRTIEPLTGVTSDPAWRGVETSETGDSRKTFAWPAFFYERAAGLFNLAKGGA